MLTIIKGDLIKAFKSGQVNVIAHQCNCYCTMGAGLAKSIKQKYPEAYEADLYTEDIDPQVKLGSYSYTVIKTESLLDEHGMIFNLYGQLGYGTKSQQTDYNALRNSLRSMCKFLQLKAEPVRVGLPCNLGCGLAGGDWSIVSQIIKEELCDQGMYVLIYQL